MKTLSHRGVDPGVAQPFWDFRRLRIPVVRVVFVIALAAAGLTGLGFWTHSTVKASLREALADDLQVIQEANVSALKLWIENEKADAQAWAGKTDVSDAARTLAKVALAASSVRDELLASGALADIRRELRSIEINEDRLGFALVNRAGIVLAASSDEVVGVGLSAEGMASLVTGFAGRTVLVRPFKDNTLERVTGAGLSGPMMAVAAPVQEDGQVIAVLVITIDPAMDFSRILSVARKGKTGHAYAFDRRGVLLSNSRDESELKKIGLIPDRSDATAILEVQIRDPGGDLTIGYKTDVPLAARAFTLMAASAISEQAGMDLEGYRDYRGVTVVGVWRWLPEHGFGVATEVSRQEAYAALRPVRVAFGWLWAVLSVALVLVLVKTWTNLRLRKQIDEVRQLGRYVLVEKIGQGGMGEVYLARHAKLRRPTAVKLLRGPDATDETIARFEREVQLTCRLTHPNTIQIYDYGRTDDGIFYYAMEYLDGLTLSALLEIESPTPPARVIHILLQVCGSLSEAHGIGLIHRDIKPQNIMLCERGGRQDVVKVLDFGLVKDTAETGELEVTSPDVLRGTPMYIAPERMRDPLQADPRSDIFAVGAVGFLLLTGQGAYQGATVMEVMQKILQEQMPRPSDNSDAEIPARLDDLIVDCLRKAPGDRPQTAAEMIASLQEITDAGQWGDREARDWWQSNAEKIGRVGKGAHMRGAI